MNFLLPSTTNMESTKNCRYASRAPLRSKDKRDPIVSKITPCRKLKSRIPNRMSNTQSNIIKIIHQTAETSQNLLTEMQVPQRKAVLDQPQVKLR
jgi:hypothetical protein